MNELQREIKSKTIRVIKSYHKSLGRLPDGNWFFNKRKIRYDPILEVIVLNGNYIDTELLIILARDLSAWFNGKKLLVPCPKFQNQHNPKSEQINEQHKKAAKYAESKI